MALELNLDVAQILNITARYQDTLQFVSTVKNDDLSNFDFTGYSANFDIRKNTTSISIQTITTSNGIVLTPGLITINAPLSSNLTPGPYHYTFKVISPTNLISTWFAGTFTIKMDV